MPIRVKQKNNAGWVARTFEIAEGFTVTKHHDLVVHMGVIWRESFPAIMVFSSGEWMSAEYIAPDKETQPSGEK